MSEPAATYESHPPQTLAKQLRPRKAWDVAVSIVVLAIDLGVYVVGAFFALVVLAFTDYCPAGCNVDAAVAAQGIVAVSLLVVLILAIVLTVVLLVRRRRGWWVATVGLVVLVAGWIIGFALYAAATSGG